MLDPEPQANLLDAPPRERKKKIPLTKNKKKSKFIPHSEVIKSRSTTIVLLKAKPYHPKLDYLKSKNRLIDESSEEGSEMAPQSLE